MTMKRFLDGIGEVKVEAVGNAYCSMIHLSYLGRDGRYRGLALEVLFDEDMNPQLSRTPGGLRTMEPEGSLQAYVDLAQEFLSTNQSHLFFMMLGRVETDLATLRRERSEREGWSRPFEHLLPRISQLERTRRALRDWSSGSGGPLPIGLGSLSTMPFGFIAAPTTAGVINQALSTGEVFSFLNDAVHSPVSVAVALAEEAGHRTVRFSTRNDPFDRSHAVFRSPDEGARSDFVSSPMSLNEQVSAGKVSNDDLLVIEVTSPARHRAISFLRNLAANEMDPVTIVFDASCAHVGRASELLRSFQIQPTIEDLLNEVERRLAREGEIGLDRYVSITELVAGLYGFDADHALEAFRTQRGDRFSVTLDRSAPAP